MAHDPIADRLIRRQEQLKAERGPREAEWRDVAELVRPLGGRFRGDPERPAGTESRLARQVFDATPALAADNLAAGLWGMITNSANEWFALAHTIDELNERQDVRLWLDACTRRLRNAFAADGQRFYAKVLELYQDLVAFGTAVFYVDEEPGRGLFFSCRHLAECFVAENDRDRVDTMFRRFAWTARQALARWGERVSPAVRQAAERDEPDRRFPFLHAVLPAADWAALGGAKPALPFTSVYVDVEGRQVVAEGGYHEFPYQVPRWSTSARGAYGESPAMLALPDIKMLNAMSKTTIVAAQKAADPPLLAPDEASVRGIRTTPGGIIYGGIDAQGRRLYEPLQTGADVRLGLEMEEQRRGAIREAFLFSLLLMVQRPGATATETLARQEEKLRLMGPHLGRIQAEFLDPLIGRVYGLLARAGALPPPPEVVRAHPGLRVAYVSPLARAQRAAEGAAVVRTVEALLPLASARPEILDNVDVDAFARAVADAYGAPARVLRDRAALALYRAERQAAALAAGALP